MKKGFTIFETLIALTVILIILAATMNSYNNFFNKELTEAEFAKLLSTLRLAYSKSVNEEGDSRYKVVFQNNAYSLRREDGVLIENIPLGSRFFLASSRPEIVFEKITGEAKGCTPRCRVTLQLRGTSGQLILEKVFWVYLNGRVELED